jgi:transketolase
MVVLAGDDAAASTQNSHRGGYVLREASDAVFTIVGTGSEVGVCLQANDELRAKGVATRVVALPCWACFEEQNMEYRSRVLGRHLPSVSLEAGATLGWTKYVDEAIGIDSFGLSAPGEYVFEYFNINAATVVEHVEGILANAK